MTKNNGVSREIKKIKKEKHMKKKLLVAVLAILMLGAFAACSITQVSAMAFSVAPNATYEKTDTPSVAASQFKVQVDMEDGSSREFALDNSLLTVQGLVNGCLDTTTVGQKTLRVSYRGFSFTFTYTVLGQGSSLSKWEDEGNYDADIAFTFNNTEETVTIQDAADLAGFAYKLNHQEGTAQTYTGTVTLAANIDLGGKQWVPIENFGGTFEGGNYTVSNLTIINTDNTEKLENQGLFGAISATSTFRNVTLDNFYIEETNNQAMTSKNYGALIGTVTNTGDLTVTVENVTVTNAVIKGTARLAGIIGYVFDSSHKQVVSVSNCYVQGSFTSINPVTVTTEDGEGDKVGGIIGQANGKNQTITNCTVLVQLAGTRDIGGIVGYLNNGTISGCTVLNGSALRASVAGGMLMTKGTRNVGGIVGSVQGVYTVGEGNTVEDGVVRETNNMYDYSNTGLLLGGFRSTGYVVFGDSYYCLISGTTETVEFATGTGTAPTRWNTGSNKADNMGDFMTAQSAALTALEEDYFVQK